MKAQGKWSAIQYTCGKHADKQGWVGLGGRGGGSGGECGGMSRLGGSHGQGPHHDLLYPSSLYQHCLIR